MWYICGWHLDWCALYLCLALWCMCIECKSQNEEICRVFCLFFGILLMILIWKSKNVQNFKIWIADVWEGSCQTLGLCWMLSWRIPTWSEDSKSLCGCKYRWFPNMDNQRRGRIFSTFPSEMNHYFSIYMISYNHPIELNGRCYLENKTFRSLLS